MIDCGQPTDGTDRIKSLPKMGSLSGDRVPLFYRASSLDLDRCPSALIIRDVEVGLPDLLRFLVKTGQRESLEALVDSCVNYIGLDTESVNSGVLISQLYRNLSREDDAEGYIVSSALFARIQDPRVACLPTRQFLVEIARRYLDSTSYLAPVIHRYAEDATVISRMAKTDSVLLFLRDALLFWPSLRVLQNGKDSVPLNFLVYTRPLRDQGKSPLLFHEYRDGQMRFERLLALGQALILDVGLYGTLIADMYQKGYFSTTNTVFFFGSRNPHLPGFLNHQLEERKQARQQVDPQMVVRYVDTIECLLKPFQLHMGNDGLVKMEMADPISLICSVAFMWSLGRFSNAVHDQHGKNGTLSGFGIPRPSANSWYLPRPIPAWSKAGEFINEWSVEKITPMEQFAEWSKYKKNNGTRNQ